MANQLASSEAKELGDSASSATSRDPSWDEVRKALKGIRFGEVRIIVQDGLIVQIERLEKHRVR